jgi:hypothetical protein
MTKAGRHTRQGSRLRQAHRTGEHLGRQLAQSRLETGTPGEHHPMRGVLSHARALDPLGHVPEVNQEATADDVANLANRRAVAYRQAAGLRT